jgi:hypothetical protein
MSMMVVLVTLAEHQPSDPLIVARIVGRFKAATAPGVAEGVDGPSLHGMTRQSDEPRDADRHRTCGQRQTGARGSVDKKGQGPESTSVQPVYTEPKIGRLCTARPMTFDQQYERALIRAQLLPPDAGDSDIAGTVRIFGSIGMPVVQAMHQYLCRRIDSGNPWSARGNEFQTGKLANVKPTDHYTRAKK